MSTIEIFLVVAIAVLLILVARLLQQNKLLRGEVSRLELSRKPFEPGDEMHQSESPNPTEVNELSDGDVEANLLLRVKRFCQLAEMSVGALADDYERGIFESRLEKAESVALSISDQFYRGAALHEIIVLHAKAGHEQRARQLLERVEDRFVRGKIEEELAGLHDAT